MLQELPDYEARRALLARDPLACAYGFQVLVGLALRHIFGLRFCPGCPHCVRSKQPCTDAFGSNATARGGVFGRIDAVFGSLECQKSGSFHLHGQFFVQCLHQFTPLSELVRLGKKPLLELLRKYTTYATHARRMVYCDSETWREQRQAEVEDEWPEYKKSTLMLDRPNYQQPDSATEASVWKRIYLAKDVEALQGHKQHHVHMADKAGVRRPLNHCKDPKDPTKCKAHFPRDKWLTDTPLLICPGVAQARDMPWKGKRSMVGMPWGPCNDPNLNGSHPALLAALRSNCDVQLPYRFPITPDTHSSTECEEDCDSEMPIWQLVKEAQTNQAAQAGYACDYQNKRLPIAVHEVKEWMRGQQRLYEDIKDNKIGYLGARCAKRLITDCYGRGVVRGAVETSHLITQSWQHDPTAAETIKTAQVADINLQYPLRLLRCVADDAPWPPEPRRALVDRRNPIKRKLADCPAWTVYGGRGKLPQVHRLSAYEFARHFHIKQARHPFSVARQEERPEDFEAHLTQQGMELLQRKRDDNNVLEGVVSKMGKMKAGLHYRVREEGGDGWLPMGNNRYVKDYRHDWIIAARQRPYVPVIFGAQSSKTIDEQAMRVLVLFFPWVNHAEDASADVPCIGDFWQPNVTQSWKEALLTHASRRGFPTDEVKRLVMNFVFTYCLPRQTRLLEGLEDNSDNEDLVDTLEDFILDEEDMLEASLTCVRGGDRQPENLAEQADTLTSDPEADDVEAEQQKPTRLYDMTMEMFRLSNAIWQQDHGVDNAVAQQRYQDMMEQAGSTIQDHELAKRAAVASRSQGSAGEDNSGAGLIGGVAVVQESGVAKINSIQIFLLERIHRAYMTNMFACVYVQLCLPSKEHGEQGKPIQNSDMTKYDKVRITQSVMQENHYKEKGK